MDKVHKEDYNTITAFVDVPESLSYNDYKQVIIYTTSFDYESIEDSRMTRCSVLRRTNWEGARWGLLCGMGMRRYKQYGRRI